AAAGLAEDESWRTPPSVRATAVSTAAVATRINLCRFTCAPSAGDGEGPAGWVRPLGPWAVPLPVMPPSFWVASTKPEATFARCQGWQPWQERGWTLAPRDRGPEAGMYCWMGHLGRRNRVARPDLAGAGGVQQLADRRLRRADRAQAERAVEVCARRVEDADDDALVVEPLHR